MCIGLVPGSLNGTCVKTPKTCCTPRSALLSALSNHTQHGVRPWDWAERCQEATAAGSPLLIYQRLSSLCL